jgi:hypothetical protein
MTHPEGPGATPATAQQQAIPFHQASHHGEEPDRTYEFTPGTGITTFGPNPLPAQGYLARVCIDVEAVEGTEGTPTAQPDYPFCILNLVRLQDSNGATITELTGYNLMLMATYGGFAGSPDPRNYPQYSTSKINPKFVLKIPVALNPLGLGALANQSSSSAFKLTIVGASKTEIYSVQPTALPKVIIRTSTELFTLPPAQDSLGRAQQQTPPYNGTAQYFRTQPNVSVNKGNNNTRVTDTGNMLRLLTFVGRKASGERTEEQFPDPFNLVWDTGYLQVATRRLLQIRMREMIEQLAERDKGVYCFNWSYGTGRHAGDSAVSALLPTVTATRLEVTGSSAEAGTLDIITNTVSVAEISPAVRPQSPSATGYSPPAPPVTEGQQ